LNAGYYPFGIAAGPGGNMWFAVGYTDEIGRVNVAPPPPFTPPKCVVPNVIGQKLAKAKAKIRKRHCRVGAITCRHSSPAMRGRVIRQAPKASGKRRPYGFRVRLTVGP
jgi:streptogramin lyase